jgi:hypothetical protein
VGGRDAGHGLDLSGTDIGTAQASATHQRATDMDRTYSDAMVGTQLMADTFKKTNHGHRTCVLKVGEMP